MTKLIQAATAASLVFSFGLNGAAAGNMIVQDGIEKVDLTLAQSVYTVNLQEMSGGSDINAVDVQLLTDKVTFRASGMISCEKVSGTRPFSPMGADIGFGAFNPTFGDAGVVHKTDFNIGEKYYNNSQNSWVNKPSTVKNWEVPLNKLKNPGKPSYEFDALKIFNAEMQKFINNGGTKTDFLKQDRVIQVERSLSMHTGCRKMNGQGKLTKLAYGTDTEPVTMKIQYKGNPNLSQVAAPVANNNQVDPGYQPLKITYASITPYAPSYVGKCPANLKFRVEIKGQGKGHVKFRVHGKSDENWQAENLTQIYQSVPLAFNAPEGGTAADFFYEVPFSGQDVLNKTVNHQFRLAVTWKDEKANTFETHYQTFATKVWKRRCTPQVSVGVGGVNGSGGYLDQGSNNGPAAQGLTIQAAPAKPASPAVRAPASTPDSAGTPPARAETAPARAEPQPARAAPPATPQLQLQAVPADEPATPPARATR